MGYICGICERRQFLKSMYGQLKDKSKVRLSKKVMSIQHNDDSVTVKCADGSEFEGDIVIGADGIHSRTRREMQRYARETGPPGLLGNDENCKSRPEILEISLRDLVHVMCNLRK